MSDGAGKELDAQMGHTRTNNTFIGSYSGVPIENSKMGYPYVWFLKGDLDDDIIQAVKSLGGREVTDIVDFDVTIKIKRIRRREYVSDYIGDDDTIEIFNELN